MKALVVLSGGQDSTTCLYWALQNFQEVHAVTFDYGQRHDREVDAAITVTELARRHYPNTMRGHDLIHAGKLRGSSPLTNSQEVLEQYADHQSLPGGLEKTFVPGRNLLFITLAANLAYSKGITDIVMGVCEEDYGGYPDCRQAFIDLARDTVRQGFASNENDEFWNFQIHTPLMKLTKKQTVELAAKQRGNWEALAFTHTSYDGAYPPTGHDHATLLRAKGFEEANMPDPLVLRAVREGLMPMPTTHNYLGQ